MLTLYFSATGNTKFVAELFSRQMEANCLSIEEDVDFASFIKANDTIAFCYPIYGSRVPRIMREFVIKYMADLAGKKLIIFVTQVLFSGDGARVFTDMFWEGTVEVVYAEHFRMPNNICNLPLIGVASLRRIKKYEQGAEKKMNRVVRDINCGIVKKRGFSRFSEWFGKIQGVSWQGDSKSNDSIRGMEQKALSGVKIHSHCAVCNLCVIICPMKNLKYHEGKVMQQGNCTVCYRCVNRCPKRAITVLFHFKPRRQYRR